MKRHDAPGIVPGWMKYTGPDPARWRVLQDGVARVAARPCMQDALEAQSLLK